MHTTIGGPALALSLLLKDKGVEISATEIICRQKTLASVGGVRVVMVNVGRVVKRDGAASGSGKTVKAKSAEGMTLFRIGNATAGGG